MDECLPLLDEFHDDYLDCGGLFLLVLLPVIVNGSGDKICICRKVYRIPRFSGEENLFCIRAESPKAVVRFSSDLLQLALLTTFPLLLIIHRSYLLIDVRSDTSVGCGRCGSRCQVSHLCCGVSTPYASVASFY